MASNSNSHLRFSCGLLASIAIGCLGGMIGLGGAEFRLPLLIGLFGIVTLEAVILNKTISLVVVGSALLFRAQTIPFAKLIEHQNIIFNLLAGSLVGAWWGAGHAIRMKRRSLNQIVVFLLIGLGLLMLAEASFGMHRAGQPLFASGVARLFAGLLAGWLIGAVAALLGVAGGELLIPAIVLLYGLDIKIAGSLSLAVSLPTMIVGFVRYRDSRSFGVLRRESHLVIAMVLGSILGAVLGALLVGLIPARLLTGLLGTLLMISAIKTFLSLAHK